MADILSDISQDPDIILHILDNYIGSAYSPQVDVTETATGHDVAITYDDAEEGIKTKTFSVPDGQDYVLTQEDRATIAGIVEDDLDTYIDAMSRATATANQQEQARSTAESGRVTAEQARQSAETARNQAEGTRTQAESQRAESERQRAAAEQSRATAETARATAETQRESAEQARQTAEGTRSNAEQARVTAETSRATAETTRASEWATIKADAQTATAGAENVDATMTKSGSVATVTVTDRDGTAHTATLTDGVSPTASVERVEGGALVTVADASGTTTAMLNDAEITEGTVTDAMLAQTGGILSEVHDIRTGADGKTYGSAGDAVRGQVVNIASDVETLADGMQHLSGYVVGTLNSTGGIGWGPYAISSSTDIVFEHPVTFTIADGYQFRALFKPNGSETYEDTGYLALPYSIPSNTPFKVTVMRTGDTSTPADIPLMSRKLLVNTATEYKANEAYSQAKKLASGAQLIDALFRRGALVSGGFVWYVNYRVSTPYVVRYDRALTFHVDSGFRYAIHTFDADDAYAADSGWKTGDFSIDANQGFKVMVTRVLEDTSEVADVNEFRNAVSVDTQFTDEVNSVIGNVFNDPFMQSGKPMLVAHMGLHDATTNPENTLPAFKAAGAAGMWGIETDIQITSDGKYVCIHDTTLDRTTTGTGNVNEKTLAEIRELRIKDFPDLQVPTFEEYLGACKAYGCVPCIELKGNIPNTAEAIVPIIEIIKRVGLYSKCVLFGSKWRTEYIRSADNRIPYVGIFQQGAYADYAPEIAFMKQFRRCGVALEVSGTITTDMVQECHAANMPIFAFVVDDNTAAYDWLAFGADAITTNKVTSLS